MKGLELARKYYEAFGKAMIVEQFSDVADRIAVGVVGEGSECLGFDDDISQDHDFEPGFCLFISSEDEREFGFRLERAYAKLPKEFEGFCRQPMSPAGGNRRGVIVIEDFYTKYLGAPTAPDTLSHWLNTPSEMLLAASNGEVWRDDSGLFSSIRDTLRAGYPEDVRLKKLAAHAIMAAQAGQYNYGRLIDRGENGAAQLAIFEFVKHTISIIYLLNRQYEPFYKWAYRGMRELPILGNIEDSLVIMTELENKASDATNKAEIIEDIAQLLINEFKKQNITKATCNNLNTHAYSITDYIKDSNLRNMHIMSGI